MKTLCLALLTVAAFALSAQNNRYPIVEDFRIGYIDGAAKVVIPPRFRNASFFSEGLAPAREGAYWGFIDTTGRWAIPPKYIFVKGFQDGLAEAWTEDYGLVIDRQGREWPAENSRRIAIADGEERLLPEGYRRQWKAGKFVGVSRFSSNNPELGFQVFSLIDTNGNTVVPFGRFQSIWPFYDGQALALRHDSSGQEASYALIDTSGNLVRNIENPELPGFRVIRRKDNRLFAITYRDTAGAYFYNLMGRDGNLLLESDSIASIQLLGYGRALARYRRPGRWYLASDQGWCCYEPAFDQVKLQPAIWNNGWLYARSGKQWLRIDTSGQVEPVPGFAGLDSLGEYGIYYIQQDSLATFGLHSGPDKGKRGLLHVEKGLLIPPRFNLLEPIEGGRLLYFRNEGMFGYLSRDGRIIWQQPTLQKGELLPYDIDARVPMAYTVRHTYKMRWWLRFLTGRAKMMRPWFIKVPFQKNYRGKRLYLLNGSKDTLLFDARRMGQLSIRLEARDEQGQWRRIDQCPNCDVFAANAVKPLPPGHFFVFPSPVMEGAFQTELRYVATYWLREEVSPPASEELPDGRRRMQPVRFGEGRHLYSRTFKGGVNSAQFQRRLPSRAGGSTLVDWILRP